MKKNPARNINLKKGPSSLLEEINSSIDVDQRLFFEDIEVSIAHTTMLAKQKIISNHDEKKIIKGLKEIIKDFKNGKINFNKKYEDIHMNVEMLLHKKIGNIAGKVHTARSRNDQVVTDFKLWIKKNGFELDNIIKQFQKTLIKISKKHIDSVMPGYTHLQVAQPISLAHHCLAYVEMFGRDRSRLKNCLDLLNQNPLGAGALAGTSFPIDRYLTTKLLNFKEPTRNALDSVSDRDFAVEFIFVLTLLSIHLSRLAEEVILWSNQQFKFINLPDDLATGSSIMPQKRNPDGAELVRGQSSLIISNLNALLIILKGLPMAYSKDLQDDKKILFNSYDTIILALKVMDELFSKITFNLKNMKKAADQSNSTSTDFANWLVQNLNYTFRDAYNLTGKIVRYSAKKNKDLDQITLKELRNFDKNITESTRSTLNTLKSLKNKTSFGGTAPQSVKKLIEYATKKYL
tara:strand:+ start:9438 stop:10820 length:1383 start_codon:yes stop_codon:yes gene_type:complete